MDPDPMTPLATIAPDRPKVRLIYEMVAPKVDQYTLCSGDRVLALVQVDDNDNLVIRTAPGGKAVLTVPIPKDA